MMLYTLIMCPMIAILTDSQVATEAVNTHGPPLVDKHPIYLDSFVPASMQIIAYLTELMKYEVHPHKTTTQAPTTPSHEPGLFAPNNPPDPASYFGKTNTYIKLGETRGDPQNVDFNRYQIPYQNSDRRHSFGWSLSTGQPADTSSSSVSQAEFNKANSAAQDDLDLLGKIPNDLYNLVNTIEDNDVSSTDESLQVLKFSENYDDSDVRYLLRQKKIPPTRAYVTLLSLYDNLNTESKALGLNKYSGYTKDILQQLAETSTGTSANQLHTVLSKIIERQDIKAPGITKKIRALIDDLNKSDSYLNDALRYIPPLIFDI